MSMQIDLKHGETGSKGKMLVLLIHGLGAPETWVEPGRDWAKLITSDPQITDTDIGIVTYDTSKLISSLFGIEGNFEVLGRRISVSKTSPLSIDQLAIQLKTILNTTTYRKYEKIVIVGHSMGGLIGKRFILNEYLHRKEGLKRIGGFISYATPYNGSKFAEFHQLIKRFQKHKQIEQLRSNNAFLDEMNRSFFSAQQELKSCFTSIYCYGDRDTVVEQGSAVPNMGHSSTYAQAESLPGDHGTILDVPQGLLSTNYDLLKGLLLDVLSTFDPPPFGTRDSLQETTHSSVQRDKPAADSKASLTQSRLINEIELHRQALDTIFIKRFKNDDEIRAKLIASMNDVLRKLKEMEESRVQLFLKLYRFANNRLPGGDPGLRELWELLALVNLVYPDWNFIDPDEWVHLSNLQLDSNRWVRMLYSQDKETMPEVVIGFISRLYASSFQPYMSSRANPDLFPYRLLLENINSDSLGKDNPENLCEHCNNGHKADFSKILLQFAQDSKITIFDGLESNSLTGTVSISCSSCLRQVRNEVSYEEICTRLRSVI
ncbi:ABC-three component system protein [Bacillus sp. FJAT-28004]|uniref:ABC-three component system protein n=1 Tax=Bacillus sp. FJAT-28004 TaxID=1679165 RepID=UPI0006B6779E|nr:ABC-three component system protein [Bacillus sp. FJAT-28004]